jgi:hypothetical protein
VIIQLARNGIVEAITRAFKAESPSVSSILSIAPRASGLDNDGPRMIRFDVLLANAADKDVSRKILYPSVQ